MNAHPAAPAQNPQPSARALALFDALVGLDEPQLQQRLAELQREDPSLAALVAKLIAADRASGVLDHGVLALADAPGPDVAPDNVGAFALLRLLGCGGMGEVWLAERREGEFVQQTAVKLLKRGMDSEAITARFVQERRILAELSHPNIARFVDGGVASDGRLYYAMDYVDGVPLTDFAQQQSLSVRDRVSLMIEVCEAVAYAQAHLVVHRDLKPSNILVDASRRVYVLDFGIAKLLGDSAPDDTLTRTGTYVLSPSYAAPEQILGDSISTATDVYALGVILFELLTGQLPHARQGLALAALADHVRQHTPIAPSQLLRRGDTTTLGVDTARTLREINADLDTLVLTALQAEPARRYAGAAALADDLRRWLDARPIAACADTLGYRLRKFIARNRYAVGSAMVVLLALVGGLTVALWQAMVARQQTAVAQEQRRAAEEAYRQAEVVNAFFSARISEAMATQQSAGAALTVKDWVRASFPRLEQSLADAPAGRANVRRELAASMRELGELSIAAEQGKIALDESRIVYGNSKETASAAYSLGLTLKAMGQLQPAEQLLQENLAILDGLPSSELIQHNRIATRASLLQLAQARGDFDQALALAERNIVDRGALYGADSFQLAVDYNNVSTVQIKLGRLIDAERSLSKARELLDKDPSRPIARLAFIDDGLCMLKLLRGLPLNAEPLCRRAIAQSSSAVGIDHPQALAQRVTLVKVLINRGAIASAQQEMEALLVRLRAQPIPIGADALTVAARLAALQQRWPAVESLAQESLATLERQQLTAGPVYERAQTLRRLGQYGQQPTPANLAALLQFVEPLLTRQQPGDSAMNKAMLAWCAYQALRLSGDGAAASAIEARALQLMEPDMGAGAVQQWQTWQQASAEFSHGGQP